MRPWFNKAMKVVAAASLLASSGMTMASMNDMQCLTQELSGSAAIKAQYIDATLEASRAFQIPAAILVSIKLVESGRGLNPNVSNKNTNGTTDRGFYQVNAEVWLPELQRIGLPIDNTNLHGVRNNALIAGWIYKRQLERVKSRLEAVGYYHKGGGTDQRAERIRGVYKAKFMDNLRRLARLCGTEREIAMASQTE